MTGAQVSAVLGGSVVMCVSGGNQRMSHVEA